MEWIEVEDRLPGRRLDAQVSEEVLVWTWRPDIAYYSYERHCFINCCVNDEFGGDGRFDDPVTHWMPLPAPPSPDR